MPLGDSITTGINDGNTAGFNAGYRLKLYNDLIAAGFNVDFVGSQSNGPVGLADKDHEGHPGYTINDIASVVNGPLDAFQPSIILLMIGTNDILQGDPLSSNAPANLGNLIDQITTQVPSAHLVVASITPLQNPTTNQRVETYNATILNTVTTKASQGKNVSYIDMYGALNLSDVDDGVHPNGAGYVKMASNWYNTVANILNPQSAQTLTDDFNDNTRDTVKWNLNALNEGASSWDPNVTALEQSQRLEVKPVANTVGNHYNGYVSVATWDMTSAQAGVTVQQTTSTGSLADTVFAVCANNSNWYRMVEEGGQLYFQDKASGIKNSTNITYSPVSHRFWRIRHNSASDSIFFETSGDGVTYSVQRIVIRAMPITAMRFELDAGTSNAQSVPGFAVFDDFFLQHIGGPTPTRRRRRRPPRRRRVALRRPQLRPRCSPTTSTTMCRTWQSGRSTRSTKVMLNGTRPSPSSSRTSSSKSRRSLTSPAAITAATFRYPPST